MLRPLTLENTIEMQQSGAQVLDVRDPAEFAKAHLIGSINIGLAGQYATWAGTVLDPASPEPGREQEAAMRLGRIGFDHVSGYLSGGIHELERRPDLVEGTDRIPAHVLDRRLRSDHPPLVLDVRMNKEWQQKRIRGSLNIPLNHLQEQLTEVVRDRHFTLHCAGGYRSSIAASLLQLRGIWDFTELAGGIAAWEAAGLPVVTGSSTTG